MKLAGLGGVVLVSGCASTMGSGTAAADNDFYFVQLSDSHWGFEGPAINPDAQGTLKKAVAAVNGLARQPDFVMFTVMFTSSVVFATSDSPVDVTGTDAETTEITAAPNEARRKKRMFERMSMSAVRLSSIGPISSSPPSPEETPPDMA